MLRSLLCALGLSLAVSLADLRAQAPAPSEAPPPAAAEVPADPEAAAPPPLVRRAAALPVLVSGSALPQALPAAPHGPALVQERASTGALVLGSTAGWALGLAGGIAIGYLIQPDPGESYFGAGEWWLGAWLGSSLGAAAGAHLANRREGSLLLTSLGSVASVPVSFVVALPLASTGAGVLVVPAAQIGSSVVIQRLTSRRRVR